MPKTLGSISTAPIVVITATDNESVGRDAIRCGAQDYLIKGKYTAEELAFRLLLAVERHYREIADLRLTAVSNVINELRTSLSTLRTQVTEINKSIEGLDSNQPKNDN